MMGGLAGGWCYSTVAVLIDVLRKGCVVVVVEIKSDVGGGRKGLNFTKN
jgi:hypothetical protein